jgi:hypothetical protein
MPMRNWASIDARGHAWKVDREGEVDEMALDVDSPEGCGGHNGPMFELCGYTFCMWCQSGPTADCTGTDSTPVETA